MNSWDIAGQIAGWVIVVIVAFIGLGICALIGVVFWAIAKSDCEDQIRSAEAQVSMMTSEARDAVRMPDGTTWQQTKAHARGMVTLLLLINIGLAGVYLGVWFWAKRNPLRATVTALVLFVGTIVVNGVYEPSSLYQGFIVKIFFILALAKAISAALEERRLQGVIPAARML